MCLEFTSEGLLGVLHGDGIAACGVGRDVDVEAHDAACVDGFLVDDFARFVGDAHQIGIDKRVEVDA